MKIIVHAFVIALTLTGAVASTNTPSASAQKLTVRPGYFPTPTCPPNDPNACHIVL